MYAIIDIETTGLSAGKDRITEIAIIQHDGDNITGKWSSLINPECLISPFITRLTGISNDMVATAPRFFEVAAEIVKQLEGRIFIAHNVRFDYNFLQATFRELGFPFHMPHLCTVKLSRALMPGLPGYGLDKLCLALGIINTDRHRAMGDAISTTTLFEHLLSLDNKGVIQKQTIPARPKELANTRIPHDVIDMLPESPGVYYFLDDQKNPLYIGKSINIRKRILSHFNDRKNMELLDNTSDISYELSGNELIALLLESAEIKRHQPRFNRALRKTLFRYGIFQEEDKDGYINLKIRSTHSEDDPITVVTSLNTGKNLLDNLVGRFELCQKLCGLYPAKYACFHYNIGQCRGACAGKESPESYNERAREAIELIGLGDKSFLIMSSGKTKNEIAVIGVDHGKYIGFGFIDKDLVQSREDLVNCISFQSDNRDVQTIIKAFMRESKGYEVIPVEELIH